MLPYIFLLLRIMAAVMPIYLIIRRPWNHRELRELILAVFWLFQAGLLILALQGTYQAPSSMLRSAIHRCRTLDQINLIPFHTISSFFHYLSWDDFMVNILGNMVMFIPWGFGLPLLWKRNQTWPRMILHPAAITLAIEFIQLFIERHVDVDDLLLNFMGGLLGGLLYWMLCRIFPRLQTLAR